MTSWWGCIRAIKQISKLENPQKCKSYLFLGRYLEQGRRLHVPRILLSASAEFQAACGQRLAREPDLSQILVNDIRVKDSPWYSEDVRTPERKASKVNSLMSPESRTLTFLKWQRLS
jgi:hypothetical protein